MELDSAGLIFVVLPLLCSGASYQSSVLASSAWVVVNNSWLLHRLWRVGFSFVACLTVGALCRDRRRYLAWGSWRSGRLAAVLVLGHPARLLLSLLLLFWLLEARAGVWTLRSFSGDSRLWPRMYASDVTSWLELVAAGVKFRRPMPVMLRECQVVSCVYRL